MKYALLLITVERNIFSDVYALVAFRMKMILVFICRGLELYNL
jgi:hypothetical protein